MPTYICAYKIQTIVLATKIHLATKQVVCWRLLRILKGLTSTNFWSAHTSCQCDFKLEYTWKRIFWNLCILVWSSAASVPIDFILFHQMRWSSTHKHTCAHSVSFHIHRQISPTLLCYLRRAIEKPPSPLSSAQSHWQPQIQVFPRPTGYIFISIFLFFFITIRTKL